MALVPEAARAWHAGAGAWGAVSDVNSRSIGIELANPGDAPFPAPQMTALEALAGRGHGALADPARAGDRAIPTWHRGASAIPARASTGAGWRSRGWRSGRGRAAMRPGRLAALAARLRLSRSPARDAAGRLPAALSPLRPAGPRTRPTARWPPTLPAASRLTAARRAPKLGSCADGRMTAGARGGARGKSGLQEATVPGNARPGQPEGKRHREETASAPRAGKGETVG